MARAEHWVATTRPPRGKVGPFRRSKDPEDIEPYLADAAHYPGGYASAVCFPTNEAEVAAILNAASRVLAVGAQSSLTGGATPAGGTILSTARLGSVARWSERGATVGPGLILRDLQDQLIAGDLYYPPVPTFDGASIGGTVATNAAGAATFKYGTTRDWIARLVVVLADGEVLEVQRGEVTARDDGRFEIVRAGGSSTVLHRPQITMPDVPKHSAGYYSAPGMDLIDLFIGSEGTLGIVTEIELRLVRPRPAWFTAMVFCDGEAAAVDLVTELRRESLRTRAGGDERGIDVAAMEYLDEESLSILRADRVPERLGLRIPDAGVAVLLQHEIDRSMSNDDVAADLAAIDDAARRTPLASLCRALRRRGLFDSALAALPGEESKRAALFGLRECVPDGVNRRIREAQRANQPSVAKAACDVIVPFDRFAESLRAYRRIARRYGVQHAIWGHISDGNVHPNLLPSTAVEMVRACEALFEIGKVAIDLGGCPMSEHGTGRNAVKQALLRQLYGEQGVRSMLAVKRALDPQFKLAPGVLFPTEAF
jgi:D-lactate dehydrogenase (cytochrome)